MKPRLKLFLSYFLFIYLRQRYTWFGNILIQRYHMGKMDKIYKKKKSWNVYLELKEKNHKAYDDKHK